jgi:ATP-dependent DNA ligase
VEVGNRRLVALCPFTLRVGVDDLDDLTPVGALFRCIQQAQIGREMLLVIGSELRGVGRPIVEGGYLLYLDGESTAALPLIERKGRLRSLFAREIRELRFSDHIVGDRPRFREHACQMGVEGVISKRVDRPYMPGDRRLWVKSKCLNREELVVVGWTDPSGSRPHIGALLLGYYTDDGRLHYAGRAGTGFTVPELKRLAGVLRPLQTPEMPLDKPPPRETRFGSPLELSRVHWVRPEVIVEVTYLNWTEDKVLRQVSYQGQREDKPARQVVWAIPHTSRSPGAPKRR